MRHVASETGALLVDAEEATFQWQAGLGKAVAEKHFMVSVDGKDTTHFTKDGADVAAGFIAQALIEMGIWK